MARPIDRPNNIGCQSREQLPGYHDKPGCNHRFAPPPIARRAKRNLQQALRQTVDPKRESDQARIVAARYRLRVDRKDRQDQKETQQSKRKDRSQRNTGPISRADILDTAGSVMWELTDRASFSVQNALGTRPRMISDSNKLPF